MRILLQNEWRNRAIFGTIIFMLTGLFLSRASLSITMLMFCMLTTVHQRFVQQVSLFLRSPLLLVTSVLFFVPLVSGLWSDDKNNWLNVAIIKLPFFVLPLAFAGSWKLRDVEWRMVKCLYVILAVIGSCWSLIQYGLNAHDINVSYLRAQTIPTPFENDHVRFSWFVSIAIIFGTYLAYSSSNRKWAWVYGLAIVFLAIYLHVLAVRTGLFAFYFFIVCFAVFLLRRRKGWFFSLLALTIVFFIVAWKQLPTFQNRIRYIAYDFSFVQKNADIPGTSDANRVISLKAGWSILKRHPLGVGAGDVRKKTNEWYSSNVDGITEADRIFPSSEWMVYGDVAGWLGVLLFTVAIFLPLFISDVRNRFFWVMLQCAAIGCCVLETTLEVQFGIFIYCLTILSWWKWSKVQN